MAFDFRTEVIWKSFNLFRHNIPAEKYDVLLFVIMLYRHRLTEDIIGSASLIDELRDNIHKLDNNKRIVFNELLNVYTSDLMAIGLGNIKSIFFNLSMYTFEDQEGFNFSEFFEKVFNEISPFIYSHYRECITPPSIIDLMSGLVGINENSNVYNPFAGIASFGVCLNDSNSFYGQEINPRIWAIGTMRLLAHNRETSRFKLEDSFFSREFDREEFDVVLSVPPMNMKINSDSLYQSYGRTAEDFALLRGYECLKPGGTLAVLVSNSKLYGAKSNQYLVDQGALAAVIHLPAGAIDYTNFATSIIVLKKSLQREVMFIDASKEFVKGQKINSLSEENIDKILSCYIEKNSIDDFCIKVSNNEIRENEYCLAYQRYAFNPEVLSKSIDLDPNSSLVKLDDLLQSIKSSKALIGDTGKVIRIKNLSDDIFNPYIETNGLSIESLEKPLQKITSKAILLSKRFNNLKPSFIEASELDPVYLSLDILAFEVSEHIDTHYLLWQLGSEFVKKQLEAFTVGSVMPSITAKNLLQIVIQLPATFEQQQSLYYVAKVQADKDKIVQANLQETINSIVKERTNDIQWQLHDLRNSELLGLKNNMSLFAKLISRNNKVKDIILDLEDNLRLVDFTEQLLQQVQNLTVKIGNIFEEADKVGLKEEFDAYEELRINTFFQDFLNINQIVALEKYPNTPTEISFNRSDFKKIINNVFENIKRHGFHNIPQEEQRLEIILSQEEHYLKISILNSGNYIAITPDDYFANGGRQGKTGNSGKGGYLIKQCMERNGGKVNIYTYEPKDKYDYVFKIELFFRLESNDEL